MEKIMTKIGDLWEVKEFITFKISPYFGKKASEVAVQVSYTLDGGYWYIFAHSKEEAISLWNQEVDHDLKDFRRIKYQRIIKKLSKEHKWKAKVSYAKGTAEKSRTIECSKVILSELDKFEDPNIWLRKMSNRTKEKFVSLAYVMRMYFEQFLSSYCNMNEEQKTKTCEMRKNVMSLSTKELEERIETNKVYHIDIHFLAKETHLFSRKSKTRDISIPFETSYVNAKNSDEAYNMWWKEILSTSDYKNREEILYSICKKEIEAIKKRPDTPFTSIFEPLNVTYTGSIKLTIKEVPLYHMDKEGPGIESTIAVYYEYFSRFPINLFKKMKKIKPRLIQDFNKEPIPKSHKEFKKVIAELIEQDVYADLKSK